MSVIAAAVRELLALGVEGEALCAAIERMEAAAYKARAMTVAEVVERTPGARRTAKWREKNAASQASPEASQPSQSVTEASHDNNAEPKEKGFPAPLPKTQPTYPLSPPKGGTFPLPLAPLAGLVLLVVKSETDLTAATEAIHALQPRSHVRSTRPDIRGALVAARKRGGHLPEIVGSLRVYYAMPDCRAEGGKFAKAPHRMIQADRWRDFLPRPDPPRPESDDPRVIARRRRHYADTGQWDAEWGPVPKDLTQAA